MKVVWGDSHFDAGLRRGRILGPWAGVAVRKPAGRVGFEGRPKPWIVERMFGLLGSSRRLSRRGQPLTYLLDGVRDSTQVHDQ